MWDKKTVPAFASERFFLTKHTKSQRTSYAHAAICPRYHIVISPYIVYNMTDYGGCHRKR